MKIILDNCIANCYTCIKEGEGKEKKRKEKKRKTPNGGGGRKMYHSIKEHDKYLEMARQAARKAQFEKKVNAIDWVSVFIYTSIAIALILVILFLGGIL